MPGAAGVGEQRRRLTEAQPRHDRLVDVDVGPGVIEIGDDDDRRARLQQLAGFGELLRDDAGDRRGDGGVGDRFLPAWRSAASAAATRARAASISSRRAPARRRATVSRAARTRSRAPCARALRHVAPRHRIVALLARARVGGEQRLEALDVGLRARRARRRRRGRRLRRRRPAPRPGGCPRRARRRASSRSCASACSRSACARASASSASAVSRRATRSPALTRSPSATRSSSSASADLGGDLHVGRFDLARRRARDRPAASPCRQRRDATTTTATERGKEYSRPMRGCGESVRHDVGLTLRGGVALRASGAPIPAPARRTRRATVAAHVDDVQMGELVPDRRAGEVEDDRREHAEVGEDRVDRPGSRRRRCLPRRCPRRCAARRRAPSASRDRDARRLRRPRGA